MKLFQPLSVLIFLSVIFLSCSNDDSEPGVDDLNNEFSINDVDFFKTPNAYLVFNTVTQYDIETEMDVEKLRNHFSFLFTDGQALFHDGSILFSTDTDQVSYQHFRTDSELKETIEDVVIDATTYTQTPTITTARINISDLSTDYSEEGVNYGSLGFSGTNYLMTDDDVASFIIDEIDIDYTTMTGTIDCIYSISPSWEGPIEGSFSGSFKILVEN